MRRKRSVRVSWKTTNERLQVFERPRGESAPSNRKTPISCGTYLPSCSIVASGQRSVTGLDGSTAGTERCWSPSARRGTRAGRFRCRSGSMRFLRCGEPSQLRNGSSPHPPRADTSNRPLLKSATARRVRLPDLGIFRSTPSGTLASPDGRTTWTHTRWRTLPDTVSFVTTRRYVHPNLDTGRAAMERAQRAQEAQGRHKNGHSDETAARPTEFESPVKN